MNENGKGRLMVKFAVTLTAFLFMMTGCCDQPDDTTLALLPIEQVNPLMDSIPETRSWVGDEFIISFDEAGTYNADSPDIAVAPPGTPWAGSIHAVWAELNNSLAFPFVEIHYSKSNTGSRGLVWSNDEASEGDRLISQDYTNTGDGANPGNASCPSIVIDTMGWIHVVWKEQYPDMTYEIHYSRSEDNGNTWTGFDQKATIGDILVTTRTGENAQWINQPRIAVTQLPLTIHVVWNEVSYNGDSTEVWYVKSLNQGNTWTQPMQISAVSAPYAPGAESPDIATSGPNGQILHVVWTQEMELAPGVWCSEVFYVRSMGNGDSWEPERQVSHVSPENYAHRARVTAKGDSVHVVWMQYDEFWHSEIYYSRSENLGATWSGEIEDCRISFPDGNDADTPSLAMYGDPSGQEIHAVWIERDETSPNGTMEIHYSMTADPFNPLSWSGSERDIVLSHPDANGEANAIVVSIAVGMIGGKVRPQIVWDELNTMSTGGGKAEQNNEIHYLPDQTFDIPVHQGWNLISVPLVPGNSSIFSALDDSNGDGNTNWSMVKWYDPLTPSDPWKACRLNGTANDLSSIDTKMGLWVYITSIGDGNLTVFGDYGASTQITLRTGWNLVGYPAQTSKTVSESLGSINDQPVEGYNSSSPYYFSQLSGSHMMIPGEGYWIHVASDCVWTVNW